MLDEDALDYEELAKVLASTSMHHAVEVMNLRRAGADAQVVRTLAVDRAGELITPLSVLIDHLGVLPVPGERWHEEPYSALDPVQTMSIAAMRISSGTGYSLSGEHEHQHLTLALAALTWLVTPDDASGITG